MMSFKQTLFNHCCSLLQSRIDNARTAMAAAQESANSEDKSSAGDKYETSRAMGQLARDMNAKQLAEAQTELTALQRLNIEVKTDHVITGSLIETSNGLYFIGAGIGATEVEGKKVVVLSARSPLAGILLGKKEKEEFNFNSKPFRILKID